jgi:2,3-dihydroxyphenylpropionate 1,2-dioxygenase
MSHFPGTPRYANPDVEFDRRLFETLKGGHLRALLGLDERELDEHGNVELRSWAIAAGMLGNRAPDVTSFEPSWHHTYATLAFTAPPAASAAPPHYPAIRPERVRLTELLHRLANDPAERARHRADPGAYAAGAGLSAEEAAALASLDEQGLLALGVHPLVPFLVRLQLERESAKR